MAYSDSSTAEPISSILTWRGRSIGWQAAAIFAGTLFLALASWLSVPMLPVPITMQTFAVVLVGALFGWRRGGLTIMAWLTEGALGFPVLANGTGGLIHFLGPTGGYLLAFIPASMMIGWLAERGCDGSRPGYAFINILAGHAAILAIGAAWLAVMIGPSKAIATGVTPFLLGALLKSGLATLTLTMIAQGKRRLRQS
ncbi:biotin transporter BioY [Salinisphaera sp. USBA-960]|nr:biotin transporter BioY [Salifodinibacter halophilus]NNC25883.1 biotin transporter BioY [Salifodinibacter halophilus]